MRPPPEHAHDDFPALDDPGKAYGLTEPVSMQPLALLVGAGMDGCRPCQAVALDQLANNPAAAARLVEVASMAVMDQLGGLPAGMYDDQAPGATSHHPALRAALRAAMDGGREGANRPALYRVVAALSPVERREMCDHTIDLLIGYLTLT